MTGILKRLNWYWLVWIDISFDRVMSIDRRWFRTRLVTGDQCGLRWPRNAEGWRSPRWRTYRLLLALGTLRHSVAEWA
jgi:hypothetical protein